MLAMSLHLGRRRISNAPRAARKAPILAMTSVTPRGRVPRYSSPMQDALETYKRNTREITDQFTRHIIKFPQCVTRLAGELTAVKESIGPEHMTDLADAMLVNNARVMGELERRGNKRRTDARYRAKNH
jgi:hypothetical protein